MFLSQPSILRVYIILLQSLCCVSCELLQENIYEQILQNTTVVEEDFFPQGERKLDELQGKSRHILIGYRRMQMQQLAELEKENQEALQMSTDLPNRQLKREKRDSDLLALITEGDTNLRQEIENTVELQVREELDKINEYVLPWTGNFEKEEEVKLDLNLIEKVQNTKRYIYKLIENLENAQRERAKISEELEKRKKIDLELQSDLDAQKKHVSQLTRYLEEEREYTINLTKKLNAEKIDKIQFIKDLEEEREIGKNLLEDLNSEKNVTFNLILQRKEREIHVLQLTSILQEEKESTLKLSKELYNVIDLMKIIETENSYLLHVIDDAKREVNKGLEIIANLEENHQQYIDRLDRGWRNITAHLEKQKKQRLLFMERWRQRQSSDHQVAGETKILVVEAQLQLEKEKNRCSDLQIQLLNKELQVKSLERSLQIEKESKSELQASIQKSEDLVQDMLNQLESSRAQAEELEKELLKEKEHGRELKIDTKRCKSRSWNISQENRNMTARLKVMSEQLDNTTQEILLLTAKVEARKSAVVPTVESSLPELQEKFQKLKMDLEKRKEHLYEFLDFLQMHKRDAGKWSSLVGAVEYGEPVVVQILLDAGTDTNLADSRGVFPLLKAAELGQVTNVLQLIAGGAKLTIEDKDGRTALHQAAKEGHTDVVKCLIDVGADIAAGNRWYTTPLHYAAWNGHLNATKLLLERGADVNSWSAGEWTPLHRAIEGGHAQVARFLVLNGAKLDAVNEEGETAKEMAASKGAKFLLDVIGEG